MLAGSADQDSSLLPQAFVVNLSDHVVEQMIRSARTGDDLELELGKRPVCFLPLKAHLVCALEHRTMSVLGKCQEGLLYDKVIFETSYSKFATGLYSFLMLIDLM